MYRRAIGMGATGIWAIALCAQTPPQEFRDARAKTARLVPQILKLEVQEGKAVCSIPLLEVPVTKNVERMPTLLPSAGPDNIDHMPTVTVPAPPCQEEKR